MPHVSKRNRAYSTGLCFSHSCWKRRYSMELQLVHEILHQNYLQSPSIGIVQSIIFISICFYFVHLSFFLTNESPVSCTWSSSECVPVFSPAISPSMPITSRAFFYFRSICILSILEVYVYHGSGFMHHHLLFESKSSWCEGSAQHC